MISILHPEIEECEVRESRIHRLGVFAVRHMAAGERIVEYRGAKIPSPTDATAPNAFFFEIGENAMLDGSGADNPARFINHSCEPNCEAALEDGRIFIRALRGIAAGEELTFDYGLRLADCLDHPCNCGAKNCAGFIVNRHDRPRVRRLRRTARATRSFTRRPARP